jgi:hypothetical protein
MHNFAALIGYFVIVGAALFGALVCLWFALAIWVSQRDAKWNQNLERLRQPR